MRRPRHLAGVSRLGTTDERSTVSNLAIGGERSAGAEVIPDGMAVGGAGAVFPFCDRVWGGNGVLGGEPVCSVYGGAAHRGGSSVWRVCVPVHEPGGGAVVGNRASTGAHVAAHPDRPDWTCDFGGAADRARGEAVYGAGRKGPFLNRDSDFWECYRPVGNNSGVRGIMCGSQSK